jgi:hypothetical protein
MRYHLRAMFYNWLIKFLASGIITLTVWILGYKAFVALGLSI